jgi:signal transduction histidine kinase
MIRKRQDRGRPAVAGAAGSAQLLRALLAAFVAVLLLFVAYEVVEKTWLATAEPELLRVLYLMRGATAAVLAAAVASWLILREGRPVLAAGVLPAERMGGGTVDAEQKQRHYARWYILMRWLAIVVATIAVFATVQVAGLLPQQVGPALAGLIAWLTLLNLAYAIYLRQCGASTAFLGLQVYVDIVVLILLLHFSGGIENPLTPLLLLHVIIAGIVLGRTHAYLVAGVASVLFGLLAWGECTGVLPHYTLRVYPHFQVDGLLLHAAHDPLYAGSRVVLQTVVLLLVAYFTTTLVERIRQDERALETLADRALAQAQTLERALETTGTALCLCDRELRPYWSNARWSEWAAAAPGLAGNVDACGSPALTTLADGIVRSAEIHVPPPGGAGGRHGGRVFDLTTAPLRDREGGISHVVTLARDVTQQHEAQARTRRAERLAAVGQLAGQVAHEVNNPIAIISAKARLLLRDGREELPERAAQEVAKIAELSDRVARIAQGLLSYCRPAPGARGPLDVRLPIRRALADVEARVQGAGVLVVDELPADLPDVCANAAELEQVFLNLFLNALDAMPDGGELSVGAGMVRETAVPGGGAPHDGRRALLAVHVLDTGTGIEPSCRERAFEPFFTTKEGHGTGLGLSICQGMVRSHGGDITLHGRPDGGTRVTLTIPVAAATVQAPAAHALENVHA